MKRYISLAVALALTGCATCQRHPTACAVAVGIVAGSIAASVNREPHRSPRDRMSIQPVDCAGGSCQ